MQEISLEGLRSRIDAVDERIVALLVERTEIVRRVGELKSREAPGACPIRPGREAAQLRRIVERFRGTGFSPAAAAAIWRNIIMASLSVEGNMTLSVAADGEYAALPWLAREYFSAFAPLAAHKNPRRVIGDLLEGKAAIGVLPPPGIGEQARWWPDLLSLSEGRERPYVFAHLPFVYAEKPNHANLSALAAGMVEPEPTGDDVSLLVLEAGENVSMHLLQTAFAQGAIKASWVEVASLKPSTRHHLVEAQGFLKPGEGALVVIAEKLSAHAVSMEFLGAYARPLVIAP